MIQAYSAQNKDYEHNGDVTLIPDSATIVAELNGVWQLSLHHPLDKDGRWRKIEERGVIEVPSFLNEKQLFRIYRKEKTDGGVQVEALPIFLDAKDDCFLTDVRPTEKNGQQALDILCATNQKYKGKSDIAKINTSYFEYMNLIEALNGSSDNSFLNRWGGEILYNNFEVIVNERVGGDYGVELRYGKNIPKDGFRVNTDYSKVVTRIYPKAFNGRKLSTAYVDSPNLNKYPTIMAKEIKFEKIKLKEDCDQEASEDDAIICDDQTQLDTELKKHCEQLFIDGLDKPQITINADMLLLQYTKEYEKISNLEEVSLGDTIHCKHEKLGIEHDARVTKLEFDCLKKRVTKVTIGDFEGNYVDRVENTVDKIEHAMTPEGDIAADKVQGILNAIKTQIRYQKDAAHKQDVRAILFEDMDPASPIYGAMCIGTQGLQIANERTADGRDWKWSTAATANGVVANAIMAGILSDKTGKNSWNLDTGELRLERFDLKVEDMDEAIRKAELLIGKNAENINASVQRLENNTKEALDSANKEITNIISRVDATMTADQVKLEIKKETSKGATKVVTETGFEFGENGLYVKKTGAPTETKINENGMEVAENGKTVLTANNQGVDARNLHATTYLIVGDNSRFENYGTDRTACFWIGGV